MLRPAPSFASREQGSHATSGVVATLRALGVRPSRRMGQNFLTDPRVAERIAAAALAGEADGPIVEIGPGLGALTERLAASGRPLTAVELDLRLAEHLESLLRPFPNARVVRGDILEQRLDTLAAGSAPVTIVANLPYAITSPAIGWIVEQGEAAARSDGASRVARAVLMTQREVAQRLAARPGRKEYGSFSVFVELHAVIETLFRVSPGAFHPRPDVDSIVLALTPRPFPGSTPEERGAAAFLARTATGGRRKTLVNALAQGLGKEVGAVRAFLQRAGIDPGRRAETLGVPEWLAIARAGGAAR